MLFANEVLDALPTPRFVIHAGEVYEEHVVLDAEGKFLRVDQPADALLHGAVRHAERDREQPLPDGYRSEILPQLPYWIQAVGGLLSDGVMLFVDYGYPRREYYLPERDDGTLVCHYRHHAHGDPFFLPGLQDLTAFVDFTALAEAGAAVSTVALEARVDLRRTPLELLLKVLAVDGAVELVDSTIATLRAEVAPAEQIAFAVLGRFAPGVKADAEHGDEIDRKRDQSAGFHDR